MTDENPYASPSADSLHAMPVSSEKENIRLRRCLLHTAITAIVSTVPLAGVIGLCFRFPVPFVGYLSGPAALFAAMIAAFFYAALGGVIVQAIAGVFGGTIAYQLARRNPDQVRLVILICGIASALPGLLLLSILDWIVGSW
ncbi:MAG: hypothetical protein ACK58L_15040 [Planctomycetota bacterium]